ncbi:MAG: CapA family protein [Clostridiales bacterium]|nr:CapA family protein [Clostridiales bacterium]
MRTKALLFSLLAVFAGVIAVTAALKINYKSYEASPAAMSDASKTVLWNKKRTEEKTPFDYSGAARQISALSSSEISEEMLKTLDEKTVSSLLSALETAEDIPSAWHSATGFTLNAFIDKNSPSASKDMGSNGKDLFTIGFTGDINFTDTGYVMTHAKTKENGVLDCIDPVFITAMQNADIMFVNNEFPYSDRGSPTPGKKYTFRSPTENVKYMVKLGVDIVSLANNHAYDYGPDSFADTMETLENAGILFVGAGNNIGQAEKAVSFIVNGYKVSFLAACGVESPIKTPVATENSEGIMGSYDDGRRLVRCVEKAKEESDYVIVFPHWGIENTTELTDAQRVNAKKYIDAGASAVIGCHSHCLQGMEYYKGVFIAYSLGNFWFNTKTLYTALLTLTVSDDGIVPSVIPGLQKGSETRYLESESERLALYDDIMDMPPRKNVAIDENGIISEKPER